MYKRAMSGRYHPKPRDVVKYMDAAKCHNCSRSLLAEDAKLARICHRVVQLCPQCRAVAVKSGVGMRNPTTPAILPAVLTSATFIKIDSQDGLPSEGASNSRRNSGSPTRQQGRLDTEPAR